MAGEARWQASQKSRRKQAYRAEVLRRVRAGWSILFPPAQADVVKDFSEAIWYFDQWLMLVAVIATIGSAWGYVTAFWHVVKSGSSQVKT